MGPFSALIVIFVGAILIMSGVYLLGGLPVTLIIGGTMIWISVILLYDPKVMRDKRSGSKNVRKIRSGPGR